MKTIFLIIVYVLLITLLLGGSGFILWKLVNSGLLVGTIHGQPVNNDQQALVLMAWGTAVVCLVPWVALMALVPEALMGFPSDDAIH